MFLELITTLSLLLGFGLIVLAAASVGRHCPRFKLPLITGFLLTGMLAGPSALGMISQEAISRLDFINDIALAVIAFAAGNELFLKDLRTRLSSIAWITCGLVLVTGCSGALAMYLLAGQIPFLASLPEGGRVAVSALVGAIMVARSPSSAIAIVRELHAKGPFTQMVMGVTVIMDAVVVIVFAVCSALADSLLAGVDFNGGVLLQLVLQLALSLLAGGLVWRALILILAARFGARAKVALMLLLGLGVFLGCDQLRLVAHAQLPLDILLEPLLICMVAGFLVTNASDHRQEFSQLLHDAGPPIYVVFFTLTGASLALGVLAETWPIAITLFVVRLLAIFVGSFAGGTLAGDPSRHNRLSWMAFITQAGVGIGLAREVAHEFPPFGEDLATIIISVIVINQMVGPPLFKLAVYAVKEARHRAGAGEFAGTRDTIIFGSGGGKSLTLARQLKARSWSVKVAILSEAEGDALHASDVDIRKIPEISLTTLEELGAGHADALVALLSDEENLRICELVYEHFSMETVVVRLHKRSTRQAFEELGALVVDPACAMVNLLEHFVVSPSATSLILGMEAGQEIVEIEVHDPSLEGVALRNVKLPLDTLILSVRRDGHTLLSHGHTWLKVGDHVTVQGSPENLEQAMLIFDS